jgi:hypothetical protein
MPHVPTAGMRVAMQAITKAKTSKIRPRFCMIRLPFKVYYRWVPNIRTMLVADDGREFEMLWVEWFDTLPKAQQEVIWKTSILKRRQCRQLWQYFGRTDKVPKRLSIMVNSDDMERVFPEVLQ